MSRNFKGSKTIVKIVLLLFLILFIGCKGSESAPTDPGNPGVVVPTKSPKRGLSYNLTNSSDFAALKSGVSWWYNWFYTTTAPTGFYSAYEMEFIPMLWGGSPSSNDIIAVKNFILGHPEVKYLLVMNEPNLTDQANRTPQQAAADWPKYEQVIADLAAQGRTIYLVGPQMNWGTMTNYSDPVVWLDAFYTAYKVNNGGVPPKIDYLAFHWYDYGLAAQLDRLKKYDKKIWITEMANWNPQINSYAKQAEQMTQMVAICESRSDVFRYAWFIGRGGLPDNKYTYLFEPTPGQLNDLGKLYLSLPWTK
jgi:hypothetical protein